MTAELVAKQPWEQDPTERGLAEPIDITAYLEQRKHCMNVCRDLGKNAYICAAELHFPDLRARAMLMKNCQDTKAAGGMQPRHGIRPTAAR